MDFIRLTGMQFYGRHGVFAEERSLGQRFVVHVALELDLREAGKTDALDKSVNYADVFELARQVVEGEPVSLLERLAERIAEVVLAQHSRVQSIEVEVEKPGAPIAGVLEHVSVRIFRRREGACSPVASA